MPEGEDVVAESSGYAGSEDSAGAGDPFSDDPTYRAAVIDLLGALAYGELTAFSRLAADAEMAPSQPEKAALASVAVAEFHHFEALTGRLSEMGVDPEQAMAPFIVPIDEFHDRTRPTGWLEGLVKAYVGDGIATDFYREISAYVDHSTQTLVRSVLEDVGQAKFVVKAVRDAIEADPTVGGRLALWGRRLVGEALSQSQRVAVERDALASLLVGGINRPGADLAEMGRMLARLTDEHTRRMGQLGLHA
ncbi:MAG: hydroxylase [Phycicoccus sp.]|nr:hydroxylase [Phycicoccus sp.]NMM32397.1 hydroxylase [Phycicoccus sp.]